ncbi:NAD(P)/FAD-dependent oxidoreductase [Simiduia sp. 21SJ11W-1]|uniref:phytoene desaturase family protein n=1 Tax=Simiduia sp. 21SJ11W-1 TaxID=2909669 RepID=UPI0020A04FA4|nr:NAD(P)/FAD-dependent oxidoreductase [Simiduia sp. 21SJ11W-1]UTA46710.1 NAD(P)/FAD-dependent oxidoreductase [Simiduia sp. 21SJ11W-1]
MRKLQFVIIGGGHNGLVCACYLAEAGHSVTVLERREITGGAAVTEEFHPGFKNSTASYTVSLLNPKIIHDLHLKAHGLEVRLRPQSNFFPLPSGESFSLMADFEATRNEVARFSAHDAEVLSDFYTMLETQASLLKSELLRTPPNVGGGITDMLHLGKFALGLRSLAMHERRDALDMFTKSAQDVLDSWFEHDVVKAAFAFDSIVGAYGAPSTPGSAYVLLHHVFGEANGVPGAWGHAVGGMGAITQAMTKEALARGVHIETGAEVSQVIINGNRAEGVQLADGREFKADHVVANVGPKLLFTRLVPKAHLPVEFQRRVKGFKVGSGTFRMNVALSELPDFIAAPGTHCQPHHQSGIIIGPSMAYLEQAYLDARQQGWARAPIIEMLIPSTVDDSLAPEGKHVASLFCQQFAPELPSGDSWDDHREAAAATVIDTVTQYAPNFKTSILGTQIHSPLDLERKFGLMGGDIFHGALTLDQLWSNRPFMGYADYTTPVSGLFMCGSGTHPGGGVTGIPGHNAAKEILKNHC